jgi:hypothetical protein
MIAGHAPTICGGNNQRRVIAGENGLRAGLKKRCG